jgi:hypothetical protein
MNSVKLEFVWKKTSFSVGIVFKMSTLCLFVYLKFKLGMQKLNFLTEPLKIRPYLKCSFENLLSLVITTSIFSSVNLKSKKQSLLIHTFGYTTTQLKSSNDKLLQILCTMKQSNTYLKKKLFFFPFSLYRNWVSYILCIYLLLFLDQLY